LHRETINFIIIVTIVIIGGFGGLEVACWPLEPKFAGSNPAETAGYFQGEKK
jgi:hypothetical protein